MSRKQGKKKAPPRLSNEPATASIAVEPLPAHPRWLAICSVSFALWLLFLAYVAWASGHY